MSLKITIMELLIPCEYSNKYCSYKFIVVRNLKEKQFVMYLSDVMTLTELKTGL